MAETSFRFGTDSDDQLSPDEADCLEIEEEEYDALNDETFGGLEDSECLDDWEQQHEQYAELAANSKQCDGLDVSIDKLNLEHSSYVFPSSKSSVWSYNATQNGDIFGSPFLPMSHKESANKGSGKSEHKEDTYSLFSKGAKLEAPSLAVGNNVQKKVCTVEELEREFLQNITKNEAQLALPIVPPFRHVQPKPHSFAQRPMVPPPRLPPGLYPVGMPPPHARTPIPHLHHQNIPPGLGRLLPPSHFFHGGLAPPPGLIFPPRQPFPVTHPFNFPSPPRTMHHNNRVNQHHRNKTDDNTNARHRNDYHVHRDEYDGLMSTREKQWLINIQLVQLNTGTPYFDDYYYTVFKERKSKKSKENQPPTDRNQWQNRRNNERQDHQNTIIPNKAYTPLQFENSLGKLQCGSVMAPRKIIDMDIVTPDKDNDTSVTTRDTRKIKQLLLELEVFYSYLLKAEDLKNPLYKSNIVKLCEIKQKQRLRELDMASTSEQKQEILKCLRQESAPLVENCHDHLVKVLNGLFQEDKYANFLGIRKGKMLLLRILPNLHVDYFATQLRDVWTKVLLSIPMVGRKDTAGDQLFLRFYPHFKQFIQLSEMDVVLEVISKLLVIPSSENNPGLPLSCHGKPPLNFIVSNKFGTSALANILIRTETLIVENKTGEKQKTEWFHFVINWAETLLVPKLVLVTPMEQIPSTIFTKHCNRIGNLSLDRMKLLEKWISNGS